MKKSAFHLFLFLSASAALIVSSACASSERMNRIGWDSSAYKAPRSARIAGGEYESFSTDLPLIQPKNVALQDRQVNVWPFCTVNSQYVSIMWPFIDWDQYGMAIRPFYNHEGNEYSILFPLSAWNPVNGDGWALNAYWNKNMFGAFPLFHVGSSPDDLWFVGPIWGAGGKTPSGGFFPILRVAPDRFSYAGPVWWDIKDGSSSFGVYPIVWKMEDNLTFFPLFFHSPDEFISPIISVKQHPSSSGGSAEPWTSGNVLGLGYWGEKTGGVLPFVDINNNPNGLNNILLWWWLKDSGESGLFPFAWFNDNPNELNDILLWWWRKDSEEFGLFPFAWFDKSSALILPVCGWKNHAGRDGKEWTSGNILGLGYWDNGEDGCGGFFPFVNFNLAKDLNNILLWWWEDDSPRCGLFPLAWFWKDGAIALPLGGWVNHEEYGEKWTSGDILLLGYWGKNRYGVFPIFGGSSKEDDIKYAGPFWWCGNSSNREFGFFPLAQTSYSEGKISSSYFFPLYTWEKTLSSDGSTVTDFGFTSIPYSESFSTDLDGSVRKNSRRYLIYTHMEENDINTRATSIPRYNTDNCISYSPFYVERLRQLMKEKNISVNEAKEILAQSSKYEAKETLDMFFPIFSWERAVDVRNFNLGLSLYLFGGSRREFNNFSWRIDNSRVMPGIAEQPEPEVSRRNWLLWHLLYSSGYKSSPGRFGGTETSEHRNVLGFLPYYKRDAVPIIKADFQSGLKFLLSLYLKRAQLPDTPEDQQEWLTSFKSVLEHWIFDTNIPGVSNSEAFRLLGIDRALSGNMTGDEAFEHALRILAYLGESYSGDKVETKYGAFPIFGVSKETEIGLDGVEKLLSKNVITPLTISEFDGNETSHALLLGLLARSSDMKGDPDPLGRTEQKDDFATIVFISSEESRTPEYKFSDITRNPSQSTWLQTNLQEFYNLLGEKPADNADSIEAMIWRGKVREMVKDQFSQWNPDGIIGEIRSYSTGTLSSADTQAMRGRIRESFADHWKGDRVESKHGFYPLFWWNSEFLDKDGAITDVSKEWFILPLLSGGSTSPTESKLGILCPIVYFSSSKNQPADWIPAPYDIAPEKVNILDYASRMESLSSDMDMYTFFLATNGRKDCLQWKTGTPEKLISFYADLFSFRQNHGVNEALDFPVNKQLSKYELEQMDRYQEQVRRIESEAKELGISGINLSPDGIDYDALKGVLGKLWRENTEVRHLAGIESFWSLGSSYSECGGDYRYKMLGGLLANFKRTGKQEHRSVLGYLYNMDSDGENTRKFIFPFIATKESADFSEWSFLGGMFERSVEDGKTGGRIFFFPYGNRPKK